MSTYIRSLFLLLFICVTQTSVGAEFDKGVLWEIRHQGGSASYLLGTVHTDDQRIVNLPNEVRRKFENADSFSSEIRFEPEQMLGAATSMYNRDGKVLSQLLPETLYKQTVKLLQRHGIPEMVAANLKPWAAAVTLSIPKGMTGMPLDMRLYLDARSASKQLYGLETIDEQLSVFERLSLQQQISLLTDTINMYPEIEEMHAQLMQAYLDRNLRQLYEMSMRMMQSGDQQLNQQLENSLLNERNQRMLQRMQPQLKKGNAFIAVGVLHLPGEKGLLQLLKQAGYQLSAVY